MVRYTLIKPGFIKFMIQSIRAGLAILLWPVLAIQDSFQEERWTGAVDAFIPTALAEGRSKNLLDGSPSYTAEAPPSLETTLEDSEDENYEYRQWKQTMNVSYWEAKEEFEEAEPVFRGPMQPWFLPEIAEGREDMEWSDNENSQVDHLFPVLEEGRD